MAFRLRQARSLLLGGDLTYNPTPCGLSWLGHANGRPAHCGTWSALHIWDKVLVYSWLPGSKLPSLPPVSRMSTFLREGRVSSGGRVCLSLSETHRRSQQCCSHPPRPSSQRRCWTKSHLFFTSRSSRGAGGFLTQPGVPSFCRPN